MHWLKLAGQWLVLWPIWKRMPWRRETQIVASVAVGIVWTFLLFSNGGGQGAASTSPQRNPTWTPAPVPTASSAPSSVVEPSATAAVPLPTPTTVSSTSTLAPAPTATPVPPTPVPPTATPRPPTVTPVPPAATPRPPATATPTVTSAGNCHPSYPDFCIPPPPPDLDCRDIPASRKPFTVLQPDPHRFDSDRDGIGCESG